MKVENEESFFFSFFWFTTLTQLHGEYIFTKYESDLLLINPHKFMSGYLYFSNNLKVIKDCTQTYMMSRKMIF